MIRRDQQRNKFTRERETRELLAQLNRDLSEYDKTHGRGIIPVPQDNGTYKYYQPVDRVTPNRQANS